MAPATTSTTLDDLPPSSKLVHYVLEREPQLTPSELTERTRLSSRTVRGALSRLETADLVTDSVCLHDARKRVYVLSDD